MKNSNNIDGVEVDVSKFSKGELVAILSRCIDANSGVVDREVYEMPTFSLSFSSERQKVFWAPRMQFGGFFSHLFEEDTQPTIAHSPPPSNQELIDFFAGAFDGKIPKNSREFWRFIMDRGFFKNAIQEQLSVGIEDFTVSDVFKNEQIFNVVGEIFLGKLKAITPNIQALIKEHSEFLWAMNELGKIGVDVVAKQDIWPKKSAVPVWMREMTEILKKKDNNSIFFPRLLGAMAAFEPSSAVCAIEEAWPDNIPNNNLIWNWNLYIKKEKTFKELGLRPKADFKGIELPYGGFESIEKELRSDGSMELVIWQENLVAEIIKKSGMRFASEWMVINIMQPEIKNDYSPFSSVVSLIGDRVSCSTITDNTDPYFKVYGCKVLISPPKGNEVSVEDVCQKVLEVVEELVDVVNRLGVERLIDMETPGEGPQETRNRYTALVLKMHESQWLAKRIKSSSDRDNSEIKKRFAKI